MEASAEQSKAHQMEGETEKSDLRLVLLGRAGTGKSSVGNSILGFPGFETRHDTTSRKPVTMKCEKKCVTMAGRQFAVVDTPDSRFFSERPPEEVRCQLACCESLSAPGPHAFLLCVSIHQSNKLERQDLDALEKVFGRMAISNHTIVLFTHTDKLPKDQTLEEHLKTERTDLLELVERYGDRYHVLGLRAEGEVEERECVEKLMEKVDEMVKESGESLGPPSSFLRWAWDTMLEWVLWLPSLLRGNTLIGSFVGLFIGGVLGGAMAATVGSVATEVGRRRKPQKTKSK